MFGLLCLVPLLGNAQTAINAERDPRTQEAIDLMTRFAERTGVESGSPRRYLWTDAFAVCNLLGLAHATGEERYRHLALRLIDQVHHTLGKYRGDDLRTGWISGLANEQGEAHPTSGGLRIGKRLPERAPGEPLDENLEWERDGQYFHYLTKWMHALDQAARSTGEPRFNLWARELAETAQRAFTYLPRGGDGERMYWKMSIDLSRPLVSSMADSDPLDGYITFVQLQATASHVPGSVDRPTLLEETDRAAAMIPRERLATVDPLGLGDLLADAARVEQLMRQGAFPENDLLQTILAAALTGLERYAAQDELGQPATRRLAFRELGLAIGLHALALMREDVKDHPSLFPAGSTLRQQLQDLMAYEPLAREIESFWRDPVNQRTQIWAEHRDINEVMLATSLAPDGFLVLRTPP